MQLRAMTLFRSTKNWTKLKTCASLWRKLKKYCSKQAVKTFFHDTGSNVILNNYDFTVQSLMLNVEMVTLFDPRTSEGLQEVSAECIKCSTRLVEQFKSSPAKD